MRLTYVDTAKFLAIFFVIFSHSNMSSPISAFLFSFHVQLFFICFGFVYKQKNVRLTEWLFGGGKSLLFRLLMPFALLSCIFGHPLTTDFLPRLLYGRIAGVSGIAHLWFLPCFFISAVLFNATFLVVRNKWLRILVIIFFGAISATLDYDSNILLNIGVKTLHLTGYSSNPSDTELFWGFPYTFNVALTGVVLMYIGWGLRLFFDKLKVAELKSRSLLTSILCFAIGSFTYCTNQQFITNDFPYRLITMSWAIYGNYLLFLGTSVLLSVSVLCLSALIDNPVTSRYGRSTMEIYAFHPFVMSFAGIALALSHIPSAGGLSNSVLTLLICCLLIPIIRTIDPALVGYNKR